MADKKTTPTLESVLRDEVERNAAPEAGSIIHFVFLANPDGKKKDRSPIHCVAISNGRDVWTLTDQDNAGYVSRTMKHAEFVRFLASKSVESAEVASKFAAFKP